MASSPSTSRCTLTKNQGAGWQRCKRQEGARISFEECERLATSSVDSRVKLQNARSKKRQFLEARDDDRRRAGERVGPRYKPR